ncbi:hypothetical protein DPMN_077701 [Dreissena polymorpha]|uniref:Uncharacterized protein n=1 Tax=Dreissena polymorpha TaxID=45954 RepID=A0A9D4BGV6_DREPO|nr:hypothetical protein DPMN_077701 [Dreissena polymorpha]
MNLFTNPFTASFREHFYWLRKVGHLIRYLGNQSFRLAIARRIPSLMQDFPDTLLHVALFQWQKGLVRGYQGTRRKLPAPNIA